VSITTPTNQALITESFQLIGVVREGRQPTPTQSSNAVTVLNDNIATQQKDGWGNIGWYPQSVATLGNAPPLNDADIADIKLLLAKWLAPHYGIFDLSTSRPDLADQIRDAQTRMNKRYLKRTESDLGELSRPQGGVWGGPWSTL
jgi:hypothetical protein